jgi:hypothetical protein
MNSNRSNRLLPPRKSSVPDPSIFLTDPDPWIRNPTTILNSEFKPGRPIMPSGQFGGGILPFWHNRDDWFFVCLSGTVTGQDCRGEA